MDRVQLGDCSWRVLCRKSAMRGGLGWSVIATLWGAAGGCQGDYPLAPTYCDDFCRATVPSDCPYEPENCVRDCELWRIDEACVRGRDELLHCYEQAPAEAFVCRGRGDPVVVRDETCRTERDAVLVCELPPIAACLEPCRLLQNAVDAQARDNANSATGQTPRECPLLDQSCESLCWNVLTIGTLEVGDSTAVGAEPLLVDAGSPSWEQVVQLVSERCDVALTL